MLKDPDEFSFIYYYNVDLAQGEKDAEDDLYIIPSIPL